MILIVISVYYCRYIYSFCFLCLCVCNLLLSVLFVFIFIWFVYVVRNKMVVCDVVCVIIKWSGKEYFIDKLLLIDMVGYLKEVIKEKIGVLFER